MEDLEDRCKSSAAEVCDIQTGCQDPLREYIYGDYPLQLGQNLPIPGPQVLWLNAAWHSTIMTIVFLLRLTVPKSVSPQASVFVLRYLSTGTTWLLDLMGHCLKLWRSVQYCYSHFQQEVILVRRCWLCYEVRCFDEFGEFIVFPLWTHMN